MEQPERDRRIERYYTAHFEEAERLWGRSAAGRVDLLRVQRLVRARIRPGSRVLDVGGATGVHASWLAEDGHDVALIDPVPAQVRLARRHGGFTAEVGDARALPAANGSFDAVLMLGPLYHLQDRDDRLRALREALRVLVPGGLLVVGAISRIAEANKTVMAREFADLPHDLLSSLLEHRSEPAGYTRREGAFPAGHHHSAAELDVELSDAGFVDRRVLGAEGPAGLGLELLTPSAAVIDAALVIAERLDSDRRAADLSTHLLGLARRRP